MPDWGITNRLASTTESSFARLSKSARGGYHARQSQTQVSKAIHRVWDGRNGVIDEADGGCRILASARYQRSNSSGVSRLWRHGSWRLARLLEGKECGLCRTL